MLEEDGKITYSGVALCRNLSQWCETGSMDANGTVRSQPSVRGYDPPISEQGFSITSATKPTKNRRPRGPLQANRLRHLRVHCWVCVTPQQGGWKRVAGQDILKLL